MPYRFTPWIGRHYGQARQRLLILGESFYGAGMPGDRELARMVMENWKAHQYTITALTKTAHLLTEIPVAEINHHRQDFFNGCIFYNFVQEYVGEKPRMFLNPALLKDERACRERLQPSVAALQHLLATHTPTHILGWGWRLRELLLRLDLGITRDETIDGYSLPIAGQKTALMFVPHPSGRGGAMYKHKGRAQRFLKAHGGIAPAAIYSPSQNA